ncbi:DASS family sodium-coupled anion symporter [Thiotrichales bacterium 19S11-10]|nr:DASS family sodium-coupled anion symporter [Thiotrichales bacterium 19S11-10]MCF6807893.1 DASS family sodium-coupled anion symporter [Thiotrichales bacterium 19S9-11]MCF6811907.1 DASS family sodium-coupled anion symporter [Thiotrichales bacterium 19S9-12]
MNKNLTLLGILCGVVIFLILNAIELPGFSYQAKMAFIIFVIAAFLWMSNAFPLAITGIIVLFLLPLTGAAPAATVYGYFGNSAVFFVLGAFILASPVMRSGLSTRVAISMMSRFGKGPRRLLLSIFILSSLLAFVISEHAVAAILFPIVAEIVNSIEEKKSRNFAFAAFMCMAWGAMTGGTATLLGGARAPLAIGILQETTGLKISFLQWTLWTIPIVLLMLTICFMITLFLLRNTTINIERARKTLISHKQQLGKVTLREINTLFVLTVTIILWVFFGTGWGLDTIALFGVALAFAMNITNWKEVEEDVKWGIFIMYGSAIALGTTLRDTGAANAMVDVIVNSGIQSPLMIFLLISLIALILTEMVSNAAAVAVLLPIGIALANQYGIDPRAITVAIATCAGLTYMLPVSTPAMAIVTGCHHVNPYRAMSWGVLLKLSSYIVFVGVALTYWPMIGINGYLTSS